MRCGKIHNARYERSEFADSKVQGQGTHHLFSSLLSMTNLCLLRASWLWPRLEEFANKTRQPRNGFRLHESKQLYPPDTQPMTPGLDNTDPEADTASIRDSYSKKNSE